MANTKDKTQSLRPADKLPADEAFKVTRNFRVTLNSIYHPSYVQVTGKVEERLRACAPRNAKCG